MCVYPDHLANLIRHYISVRRQACRIPGSYMKWKFSKLVESHKRRVNPVPRTATVLPSHVHTRLGRTVQISITDSKFRQLFTQLQLLNKYFQKSSHAAQWAPVGSMVFRPAL